MTHIKTDKTLGVLTLIATVFALNPANESGFIAEQQKARDLREDMTPEEQTKFDEVCDFVIAARNQTLPGRGFNSLTSGLTAPPTKPAPAEPDEPATPPAAATASDGTTSNPAPPAATGTG